MINVPITSGTFTLGQLLKKLDYVSSGGEAKTFLQDVDVFINEVCDRRRGRKLGAGDIITIEGKTYRLTTTDTRD